MHNWNTLWTNLSQSGGARQGAAAASNDSALWNPTSILELQTQLWSQFFDASRQVWAMYMSALPAVPWLPGSDTAAKPQAAERVAEVRAEADPAAMPDPASLFEAQTRLWNHMLDANRSIWSPDNWMSSGQAWPLGAGVAASETVAPATPRRAAAVEPAKRAAPARSTGSRGKAAKPQSPRHH